MNISQSSLNFSLCFHSFLVGAVILFVFLASGGPRATVPQSNSKEIEIRPVQIEEASFSPPSGERATSSEVATDSLPVPPKPSQSRPAVTLPTVPVRSATKPRSKPAVRRRARPKTGLGRAYPQAAKRIPVRSKKSGKKRGQAPKTTSKKASGTGKNPWGVSAASPTPPPPKYPKITREAVLVDYPEIKLSERFPEINSSSVKARFEVATDGSYQVTLVEGTGNLSADVFITGRLTTDCEWEPALKDGVPIPETNITDIDLEE